MDQSGIVANPARGRLNGKKTIFPCPRSHLRIWCRGTGSATPSRVRLFISILKLNLVLTYEIPPEFRVVKPPYVIGPVPSLSGHAIAYRWRSLPRVRRHRTRKPQGSSERVLPSQVAMDQLVCASLWRVERTGDNTCVKLLVYLQVPPEANETTEEVRRLGNYSN